MFLWFLVIAGAIAVGVHAPWLIWWLLGAYLLIQFIGLILLGIVKLISKLDDWRSAKAASYSVWQIDESHWCEFSPDAKWHLFVGRPFSEGGIDAGWVFDDKFSAVRWVALGYSTKCGTSVSDELDRIRTFQEEHNLNPSYVPTC
jgi:hypothetical protein